MQPSNTYTPLSPEELNKHHFGETDWKIPYGGTHHYFHINRIEDIVGKIQFPLLPHRKTVCDFIFLENGNTCRSKGLQLYEFGENTFFFLPAYQISTHEYMSSDAKGFFCHFDLDIFNQLFPHTLISENFNFLSFSGEPLVNIQDNTKSLFVHILQRLKSLYEQPQITDTNLIASYLLSLFYELKQQTGTDSSIQKNAAMRLTEKYKHLLSRYVYEKHKVTEYAEILSVTPDHLNKCVKTMTGKTSQDLLADMLILEAKVMLKQTDLSISEIAFKLSESNPSDFSRFFKSKTNCTPKEFRQSGRHYIYSPSNSTKK